MPLTITGNDAVTVHAAFGVAGAVFVWRALVDATRLAFGGLSAERALAALRGARAADVATAKGAGVFQLRLDALAHLLRLFADAVRARCLFGDPDEEKPLSARTPAELRVLALGRHSDRLVQLGLAWARMDGSTGGSAAPMMTESYNGRSVRRVVFVRHVAGVKTVEASLILATHTHLGSKAGSASRADVEVLALLLRDLAQAIELLETIEVDLDALEAAYAAAVVAADEAAAEGDATDDADADDDAAEPKRQKTAPASQEEHAAVQLLFDKLIQPNAAKMLAVGLHSRRGAHGEHQPSFAEQHVHRALGSGDVDAIVAALHAQQERATPPPGEAADEMMDEVDALADVILEQCEECEECEGCEDCLDFEKIGAAHAAAVAAAAAAGSAAVREQEARGAKAAQRAQVKAAKAQEEMVKLHLGAAASPPQAVVIDADAVAALAAAHREEEFELAVLEHRELQAAEAAAASGAGPSEPSAASGV